MKKILLGLSLFLGMAATSSAQSISLTQTGTPYTQNFDQLSNTAGSTTNNLTIPGWFLNETGGGARDNEQFAVDNGGSNTGDTYSYGSTGSTDRALGGLRTGTLLPVFGAFFTNDTGAPITSVQISYTGEHWRLGTTSRTDQLTFSYSTNATSLTNGTWTSVSSLAFTSPTTTTTGAKDGNDPANRTAISSIITGLNIPVGGTIYIRWDDVDATSSDDGLAVDDFSLTANPTPLPVSLTSFKAKANLKNVDLTWNTSSENNNSHFEVLRSGDGKTFNKIDEVRGAGTSNDNRSYAYTDRNPLPGVNYYKLKQVDYDGQFSFSEVEAVKSNVATSNFKVAANKQNGSLNLTVYAANEGKATFKIYDLNGRKLVEQELNLGKGYSNVTVPFNGGSGLHIASLTTATETVTQKFIQ